MKQFIYLDSDNVNSLIAQINNGLEDSFQQTHEKANTSNIEKSNTTKGDIKGGINIPSIANFGSTITGESTEINKNSDNEIIREIHNKKLHDSVFNQLMEYLQNEKQLNPNNIVSGSFIKIKGLLEIIDFEYIEKLFGENAFIKFLKETQAEEIRKTVDVEQENLSREQRRKNEADIKKYIAQLVTDNNKQFEDIEKIIKALKYIMPYKRVALSAKGYLIPLDERWFRDTPDLFGFKYGGEITFVGYVTNLIIKEIKEQKKQTVFATLQTIINQTLFPLISPDIEKLYILHPIALYFDV